LAGIDWDDWSVSSGSVPSYEQLAGLVAAQAAEIERLTARVAELERRLGLNSKNSSKPVCHEREGGVRM